LVQLGRPIAARNETGSLPDQHKTEIEPGS
jgi:hypothetical protein